jgi:3-deoxy-manno-octulosonate cytidylyltransferase (CMP-KDO synthetase)
MKNTAIIIPIRLEAKRFPNKPLAKINNIPMIIHVLNRAKESKVGRVLVATPDEEIVKIVEKNGGEAVLTKKNHPSGSDRVYEAYLKKLENKVDLIINLQGDMPNIKPSAILKLKELMKKNDCDIGTLASIIKKTSEVKDPNVVKVEVIDELTKDSFMKATDFFRTKNDLNNRKTYHHVGIYAFTTAALTKYVMLSRAKLEIERNLEQMRAMENNLVIKVGLCEDAPLGVDTEKDLHDIIKEMKLK